MKNKINKAIIYDEIGIASVRSRALKEIISKTGAKSFVNQEILLCDKDNVHGIIALNEPHILDVVQFQNHASRHFITEEGRENIWPGVTKFNAFSFRIKKIYKEPLEYMYIGDDKLAVGKFVKGIFIKEENIDYTDMENIKSIIKYEDKLETLKNIEVSDEDKALQDLFLSLYSLFLKRLAEKARHNPAEDSARRNGKKRKPKKKTAEKINA